MIKNLLISALLICLFVAPAQAAIDDAGATELKTMFEELLAFQKASMNIGDGMRLQADGEVSVEQSGTYYSVTLPYLKLTAPDERRFEIGIISINAIPHDKSGHWKMTMALPTPMVLFDKDGKPETRFAIGQQKAAGIWSKRLLNFHKLGATFGDVVVSDTSNQSTITLPKVDIRYDYNYDGDENTLSGAGSVTSADATLSFADNKSVSSIDEIQMTFSVDKLNIETIETYREQILTLNEHGADIGKTPGRMEGFYNILSDMALNSNNGFKTDYSVKGVKMTDDDGKEIFSIQDMNLGLGFMDLLKEQADLSLNIGANKIKSASGSNSLDQIVPDSVKLDWVLKDLPFKQLAALSKNTAIASISKPEMASLAALSLLVKVPAILAQSGTVLEIKDNSVYGDGFKVTLDGTAKADLSAVNSMSVEAMARFEGLETLMERMETLRKNPEYAEKTEDIDDTLSQLKALKAIGKREDGAEKAPIYLYKFEVTPDGKILLNEKDFFQVMKEMDAAKAPDEDKKSKN